MLSPGTRIGKYRIRRLLAEGGMAELYLASQQGPEGFAKDVVIKRIRPHLARDPAFVEMFIAEARLASRLDHKNVVHIFDFDRDRDTYYLAMEYVRGASLWQLRKRCREQCIPVPPVLVAQIGAEVARGLAYAHRLAEGGKPLGLVHRDVSPHNVLLSVEGEVKLTDWGIAKAGTTHTQPGTLKGKFAYMSPEQARGEPVDARTDVFALGIVLWELLTGGRLFDADSDAAVLTAVQTLSVAPPHRLNPEVPEELGAAIMRALDRDLGARLGSAAELERLLAGCVLTHAKSLEDSDVGGFLRKVMPEVELAEEPAPLPADAPTPADPQREPTAVMPGRAPVARPPPVEDSMRAPTAILRRDGDGRIVSATTPSVVDIRGEEPSPGSVSPRAATADVGKRRLRWAVVALGIVAIATGTGALAFHFRARPGDDRGSDLRAPQGAEAGAQRSGSEAAGLPDELPPALGAPATARGLTQAPVPARAGAEAQDDVPPLAVRPASGVLADTTAGSGVQPAVAHEGGSATSSTVATPHPQRGWATVTVDVFPAVLVRLDGRSKGELSGRQSFRVAAGSHHVVFVHAHRTETVEVDLAAGEQKTLTFNAFRAQ